MDIPMEEVYLLWHVQWENATPEKSEVLKYGIARRIEQVSEQVL